MIICVYINYVHVKYMCVPCMHMIMWMGAYMHPCTYTSGAQRLASAAFHLYSFNLLRKAGSHSRTMLRFFQLRLKF